MTPIPLLRACLALAVASAAPWAAAQSEPAAAAASASVYKYHTPKLTRAQFDALVATPERVVIIDVRRPDELTKIGGFPVYLSIQSKELADRLGYIPRDRQVITVSNHASRAGAAADLLAGKGFDVKGAIGAQEYEAEGGTLLHVAAPTTAPVAAATGVR